MVKKQTTNIELLAEMVAQMRCASVHAIASVDIEPSTAMTRWRLFQVRRSEGQRTRHLVGRADREGRVCSAIVAMDVQAMRMTTESGRVYQLHGAPGRDWDADYVFGIWKRLTGPTHPRDLTRALVRLRQMRGGVQP
jgi:hypothetical protein